MCQSVDQLQVVVVVVVVAFGVTVASSRLRPALRLIQYRSSMCVWCIESRCVATVAICMATVCVCVLEMPCICIFNVPSF